MCTDGDPLQQLTAAIDALVASDPAATADGGAVVALHCQLSRLEAVATRACGAFGRGGEWAADGARTPSAWLAARCRLPERAARRRAELGRVLPHLPVAGRAWLTGDIGSSAVEVLARARNEATAGALGEHEAELVGHARTLHPRTFARVVAYWRQAADPDGVEEEAAALHAARRVHLSSSFEGAWFLDGLLDPLAGEVVAGALRGIEDDLFRSDWAEARAEHGERASADLLRRSGPQRRADALVELARRGTAVPKGARARRPLFTVYVDYATFTGRVCELARSRSPVSPGSLVPWLGEADVERVVFDGEDRVLGVGARRRFFSGADRRAVEVRARECASPMCDVPAEDCEVDHVVPFAEGGPTVPENGRLACGFHNRLRPGASRPRPEVDAGDDSERGPP